MYISKENIRNYVNNYLVHKEKRYATEASQIMAVQWRHEQEAVARNIKSMVEESKDNLPCHIVLVLKNPQKLKLKKSRFNDERDSSATNEIDGIYHDVVVGHVKLCKADGRGDGACCISYSLVVPETFRGFGLGRVLTEEAENYARALHMVYMYLSTSDKVGFYEHLGYKQCEPVSALGNNSKRLTHTQLSSLEGLFAKRLNVCNPLNCNIWLRKRLLNVFPFMEVENFDEKALLKSIEELRYDKPIYSVKRFYGLIIPVRWQQQTGPSCGISALNMVHNYLKKGSDPIRSGITQNGLSTCECVYSEVPSPLEHKDGVHSASALETALELGISNDGEMFCVYNLAFLAQTAFSLNTTVKEIDEKTGCEIIESIKNGLPVLIPYDRSLNNHTPGLFNGAHAHWAVIVGIVQPVMETQSDVHEEMQLLLKSASIHENGNGGKPNVSFTGNDFILICQHGMSKKLYLCTYAEMVESNSQLYHSKSKFYLAAENLKHLRQKIVFFFK